MLDTKSAESGEFIREKDVCEILRPRRRHLGSRDQGQKMVNVDDQ